MSETTPFNPQPATLHTLIREDGTACTAFATKSAWVDNGDCFSEPTDGNEVKYFVSGKAYFADLIQEIDKAQSEIYIAGWQINWDCQLAPGVRLYDKLVEAAKRGVRSRIMPWDDTSPVQTYDDETEEILESINKIGGITGNPVQVNLAKAQSDLNNMFYSHHQKQIIIDRKIAYVGGLDLAYGRYDDEHFHLKADEGDRLGMNRYNPCIYPMQSLFDEESARPITCSKPIAKTAIQVPDLESDSEVPLILDSGRQPRMPWHDAHCRIEGPAVADLLKNYVTRWNCTGERPPEVGPKGQTISRSRKWPKLPPAPPPSSFAGNGSCSVQVLRSAPACLRNDEARAMGKQLAFDAAQDDIYQAMMRLICGANHFIYIENQFFVSEFGTDSTPDKTFRGPSKEIYKDTSFGARATRLMRGDADAPPSNNLCEVLAGRIGRAILDPTNPNFHVYLVLPVHPEGRLNNGPVAAQVHCTMQTLVFGSQSLLNRVRRFLKARELRDECKDNDWGRALQDDNKEFESIKLDACDRYVTLLNLRNWAHLEDPCRNSRYVTEQIYVHSKLMVVDDRFALLGSANINDRSQLGSRDSELSVLVVDSNSEVADLCGSGAPIPVRGFARDLRHEAWFKIFGITSGIRPATELADYVHRPADPKAWQAIQRVARRNAELFEDAFDHIPRNPTSFRGEQNKASVKGNDRGASLWPTWNYAATGTNGQGEQVGPMPFEPAFWDDVPDLKPEISGLADIKGFITALPVQWTLKEYNRIPYHGALISRLGTEQNLT